MKKETIRSVAVRAAKKAGAMLLKEFAQFDRTTIEIKSHGQILTQADLASNRIIIQEIKNAFPEHDILSEETGDDGITSEYLWVIDPIDGTTNFSFHNPLWSISIGVVHNGEIVLGVVYVPTQKEMYVAEKGKGATRNGKLIHVSTITTERALHTFCHGGSKRDIELAMAYATNRKEQRIDCRQLGSAAIELAYVASGRVESFVIPGTKPWDVVAGVLLVKEAGGTVTDFGNRSFILKTTDMIASNGLVHNELLKVVQKI